MCLLKKKAWLFIIVCCTGNWVSAQTISGSRPRPTDNSPTARKTWTCDCPESVQIGFRRNYAGWKEGFGGGTGMIVPFQGAFISGQQVITCIYAMKDGDKTMYTLIQQPPDGYTCTVEKLTGNEKLDRRIICRPSAKPVTVKPQTN